MVREGEGEGGYFALLSELLLRKGFFLFGFFDDHGHVVLFFFWGWHLIN